MCRVTVVDPLLCPCRSLSCPRFRDTAERRWFFAGKLSRRGHVVGAEEVIFIEGLPCAPLFSSHARQIVEPGSGDAAMQQTAVRYCAELTGTLIGAPRTAGALCSECATHCDQNASAARAAAAAGSTSEPRS